MTIVLFAIGLVVTAAGFVALGFGVPNQAFGLGNTLIVSGTVAVAGGLILIGLSVAIGQLRRIADALRAPHRVATESAPAVVAVSPGPARSVAKAPDLTEPAVADFPAAPEPVRTPEPRHPEQHFSTPAADAPAPLDWLRSRSKSVPPQPPVEAPVVEVPDEAPLSPRGSQRGAAPPAAEPANEPKVWSPARESAPPPSPTLRVEHPMPRATPQVEPPKDKDRFGFDLVWPDRGGGAAGPSTGEPAKREPALDMPMPPVPARPRESRVTPEKRAEPVSRKPVAERGPAILKSGVIDGMPYTLYADGSIEAQLPQGTVKFASVDALRAHLENQA